MSTKQEIVSDAHFKAQPFSSDFNFGCRNVRVSQQHANAIVHCLQAPPLPIVAKSSILNVVELLDSFLHENQSFFLFRNVAIFIESHCVFLLFTV